MASKIVKYFCLAAFYGFANHLPDSDLPFIGRAANAVRVALCRRIIKKAGKIATISKNVSFGKGFDVEMGDFSGLGRRCRIPNNTIIGRFVMMAPEVYVSGGNHRSSRTDIPMCLQGSEDTLPTVIGDDVWIGMRAIIVNGIKIGNGAILSAGCVVTKDIPEYTVVGGVPARVIKSRK